MERTHAPRPASDLFNAVGHLSLKQLEVFQVIQDTPDGMQVAQIGSALGMHPNTVRGHLDELMAAGVVNRHIAPAGPRPPLLHLHRPRGAHESGVKGHEHLGGSAGQHPGQRGHGHCQGPRPPVGGPGEPAPPRQLARRPGHSRQPHRPNAARDGLRPRAAPGVLQRARARVRAARLPLRGGAGRPPRPYRVRPARGLFGPGRRRREGGAFAARPPRRVRRATE
ncbi:helix-turn-helix domain-containing protein [Corynebacterium wankanglinii]|nr:helix-turn-helix domain-containing protein [Corynebacterium wankanglinii]